MFLLYYSEGCNTSETVFHWCYVSDLHTTHAVVCWVTAELWLFHPSLFVEKKSYEGILKSKISVKKKEVLH
jgi:hypothetical protein